MEPSQTPDRPQNLGSDLVSLSEVRPNRIAIPSFREFRRLHPDIYSSLVDEFDRGTDGLLRRFIRENKGSSRQYLSNVLSCGDAAVRERLLFKMPQWANRHQGKFFIWKIHRGHCHVVHDCVYSGSTCRCYFSRDTDYFTNLRKADRERKRCDQLDELDWINIL